MRTQRIVTRVAGTMTMTLALLAATSWAQVTPSTDPIVRPAFEDIVGRKPDDAPPPSSDPRDFNGTYLALTPTNGAASPNVPVATPVSASAPGTPYVPGPIQLCKPIPLIGGGPADVRLVLQTPQRITFLQEDNHVVRRVYLDRSFPDKPDKVEPSYLGYSIGHWDGDTLVVETRGFRTAAIGSPQMVSVTRVVDRIHKTKDGTLEHLATVEGIDRDGKAITAIKRENDEWRPDLRLVEYSCEDGSDLFFSTEGHSQ